MAAKFWMYTTEQHTLSGWFMVYETYLNKAVKNTLTNKSLIPVSRLLFHHTSVLEVNKCTADTMTVSNKAFSVFCHTCSIHIIYFIR